MCVYVLLTKVHTPKKSFDFFIHFYLWLFFKEKNNLQNMHIFCVSVSFLFPIPALVFNLNICAPEV